MNLYVDEKEKEEKEEKKRKKDFCGLCVVSGGEGVPAAFLARILKLD